MTPCPLSLWLLMSDPFGMISLWPFRHTKLIDSPYRSHLMFYPPAQAVVESLTGLCFKWLIWWFVLKEIVIWEESACSATSEAELEWSLASKFLSLANTRSYLMSGQSLKLIIPHFFPPLQRQIAWFQICLLWRSHFQLQFVYYWYFLFASWKLGYCDHRRFISVHIPVKAQKI